MCTAHSPLVTVSFLSICSSLNILGIGLALELVTGDIPARYLAGLPNGRGLQAAWETPRTNYNI